MRATMCAVMSVTVSAESHAWALPYAPVAARLGTSHCVCRKYLKLLEQCWVTRQIVFNARTCYFPTFFLHQDRRPLQPALAGPHKATELLPETSKEATPPCRDTGTLFRQCWSTNSKESK